MTAFCGVFIYVDRLCSTAVKPFLDFPVNSICIMRKTSYNMFKRIDRSDHKIDKYIHDEEKTIEFCRFACGMEAEDGIGLFP